MHDARVVLKDGTVLFGPIWIWRPKEGWFTIIAGSAGETTVRLAHVESGVQRGERWTANMIDDRDVLARARQEGWDGT
jgi:hypothetical protein